MSKLYSLLIFSLVKGELLLSITQLLVTFMLIEMVFVIISEMFHGKISLIWVLLVNFVKFANFVGGSRLEVMQTSLF